ncbi:hypothetical protein [Sphingomonas palmae]|uniref:hypothetical protein n=1 Tax=Sphingomonas palmae TaxID=1855283 RepID=UPI000B85C2B4|nr:hypothetical protein [Sphingomonas palmae]
MNFSRLFRSRWAALWWAGGVIWFAYDVASAAPDGSGGANVSAVADVGDAGANMADVAAIANMLGS